MTAVAGSRQEPGADGVDGNARLTGATGVVLLIALFVEGITILQIRGLITLHIFLGLLLVPPTMLKMGSTAYRFVRYYRRSPAYVRRGPPPPLLRWSAPLLIASTVAVLATGVALLAVRPETPGLLLTAHQVSFFFWFGLTTLHVLGHVKEAAVLSLEEWWPREHRSRRSGSGRRSGLIAASVLTGVALGASLLPVGSPWINRPDLGRQHRQGASQVAPAAGNPGGRVSREPTSR